MNGLNLGFFLLVLIAVLVLSRLILSRSSRRMGLIVVIVISTALGLALFATRGPVHRVQPGVAVSYQLVPPTPNPPPPLDCPDVSEELSEDWAEIKVPEVSGTHFEIASHARGEARAVSRTPVPSNDEAPRSRPFKSAMLGGGTTIGLMLLTALFLDATRFGRYTLPVRVGSAATFVGLCFLLWKLGPL